MHLVTTQTDLCLVTSYYCLQYHLLVKLCTLTKLTNISCHTPSNVKLVENYNGGCDMTYFTHVPKAGVVGPQVLQLHVGIILYSPPL